MKKLLLAAMLWLPITLVHGQGGPIILEEGDTEEGIDIGSTGSNFFDRHFSGKLVGSYAGLLSETTRYHFGAQLRYAQSWDSGISLVGDILAYTSYVSLEFEQETLIGANAGETRIFDEETEISRLEIREAYVRFNNRFIDAYIGRRLLTLGQFNAFSPVDFLLPIDLSTTRVEFSKVANKYPQTTFSLYFYPLPQLELSAHYFPFIERDPITREILEGDDEYEDENGVEREVPFRKPGDENQYIGRILYNGENFVFGFTYYYGFEIESRSRPRLALDGSGNVILSNQNFRRLPTIPEPSYNRTTGYGLEFAVPFNNFSFKYEALVLDTYTDFGPCRLQLSRAECTSYFNMLNTNFDGRAYTNSQFLLQALGYDYTGDDWTVNLALYNAIDLADSKVERARDLGDGDDEFGGIFPGFNIARHYGNDKKHTTGFGMGFLTNSLGLVGYHGWEINEDLLLGFSLELLEYRSDDQVEERYEEDEENNPDSEFETTRTNSLAPALRFSVIYSF